MPWHYQGKEQHLDDVDVDVDMDVALLFVVAVCVKLLPCLSLLFVVIFLCLVRASLVSRLVVLDFAREKDQSRELYQALRTEHS